MTSKSKSKNKNNNENKLETDYDIKLIIIGNTSTGKTSIVNQFINKSFNLKYTATIASDFQYKLIKIDNLKYRIQFWDLAGADNSQTYMGLFCRDIHGIIICCSCDDSKSREDTLQWKNSLNGIVEEWVPIILCENKCDLFGETENDYLKDVDSLNNFSEQNNFLCAFRVSAKVNYNINEMINYLVKYIKNKCSDKIVQSSFSDSASDNDSEKNKNRISLGKNDNNNKKSCHC
jgi:small GTP-binding protein